VLAHRGGRGPWRENTLAAFAGALAAGADGVELDVRRSADGVAVVHHDADVEGSGPIAVTVARELPAWLPTLAQALEVCAGAVVNVELKLDEVESSRSKRSVTAAGALAQAVAPALVGARCGVVVSSFWPEVLEAASDIGAGMALALLVHPAFDAVDGLVRARALGCAALHPHVSAVTAELVERAHDLGLGVTTWTANEPSDVGRALAGGVDGLITDEVAATVAACRPG
jgi:glycerophosphoryl diester phosphodiesterase